LIVVQEPTYGVTGAAQVLTGPAGSALGPPQTWGPASDYRETALGTSTGAAVVALRAGGDQAKSVRIFVSVAPRARSFRKPTLVYTDKTKQIVAIAAAINKRGDVFVAWARGAETISAPIEGRFRYASGRLGKVRRLGSGSVWFSRLHVALAGDRRAIVTWVDQELAADGPGALTQGKLKAAVVTAAGRTREQILQRFHGAQEPNDFSAMFGSDGKGIAAWAGPTMARFARLGRDRFGAPADLGPVSSSQDRLFGLAAGPGGRSLAVWSAGPELRASVIPRTGRPAGYETVVARADGAAPAFDPVSGSPFVAFAATADDGTSRISISQRGTP
jgi:hypothetical protein